MTAMASAVSWGPPLEFKATDGGWGVTGLAATWDRDLQGDRIEPGAFKRSLASGARVRFLYAHQPDKVLGTTRALKETSAGLWGEWTISKTSLGAEIRQLILDGALDSLSIGYITRDHVRGPDGVRVLRDVDLAEVSVVVMPANTGARIESVKAAGLARPSLVEAYLRGQLARQQARRLMAGMSLAEQRGYAHLLRARLSTLSGGR